MTNPKPLYLCGGLQSSGSTLVAWCFLQHPQLDGVLDARNDLLPDLPSVEAPGLYCKITISCFRLTEMIEHYRDEGWTVHPQLVVRDVRSVFSSLLSKPYGSNGTAAEEPPLRMRLRRFKEDWQDLRGQCSIIRYESLLTDPRGTLVASCDELQLPWHTAMLEWPKTKAQMADPGHGSKTFRHSRGQNFADTVKPTLADVCVDRIPPRDLEWLEREFAEFNRTFGYAEHISGPTSGSEARAVPSWQNTRRYRKSQEPMARAVTAFVKVRNAIRNTVAPKDGRE